MRRGYIIALVIVLLSTIIFVNSPQPTPAPNNTTSTDLKGFLRNNTVDQHEYNDSYQCVQFSRDLVQDLHEAGYPGCTVHIYFPGVDHMVVATNTTEGIKYIEPQTDNIINLTINTTYLGETIQDVRSCYD